MCSLWLQKLVLLDVYRRILRNLRWERLILTSYFAIFSLTYVIVQVFNISECKPVYLYWQVDPDPGMPDAHYCHSYYMIH